MRQIFRGNRGIFLITLLLLWSVIAIALAVLVLATDPPTEAWIGLSIPVAVATGLSIAAYALLYLERPRAGLPESQRAPRAADVHRILVVANETLHGPVLRDEVCRCAAERPTEVLVVAPALSSAVAHWTDAEDAARDAAAERLGATCATLSGLGVRARGEVGADDPLRAVEDALRTFGADEMVVSTHAPGSSNWLEDGVVERLRDFYDIPVLHVVERDREDVHRPRIA